MYVRFPIWSPTDLWSMRLSGSEAEHATEISNAGHANMCRFSSAIPLSASLDTSKDTSSTVFAPKVRLAPPREYVHLPSVFSFLAHCGHHTAAQYPEILILAMCSADSRHSIVSMRNINMMRCGETVYSKSVQFDLAYRIFVFFYPRSSCRPWDRRPKMSWREPGKRS